MKQFLPRIAVFLPMLCLFLTSCHKGSKNACDFGGGVVSPDTYIFWINQDFACGPITVSVKDEQGATVTMFQAVTSYIATTPPECNNVNYGKYATVELYGGKRYTYNASCTSKTWSGTIDVPCSQGQCLNVQLK